MDHLKRLAFALLFLSTLCVGGPARADTNYHLVGWFNTFVPGGGQLLLGDYALAGLQFTLEVSTFWAGYAMSKRSPLTLDGVPEGLPGFKRSGNSTQSSLVKPLYADILQEVGIKSHFVDVFNAYHEAAKAQGVTANIDQHSTNEMFLQPFTWEIFSDPFVYVPIGVTTVYALYDYFSSKNHLSREQHQTPYSNFLYALNYGVVQPFGSGVPEEMFFRGFLQNEFYDLIPSPFFAIPAQTALFAFAHGPGDGRISAAIAGGWLGYLAYRNHGELEKGITVHYWGVVMLGIDTILLNQSRQHSTPPTSLYLQINY